MTDKVQLQESKEFQLKLDLDAIPASAAGPTDETLFRIAADAIRDAVASLGHDDAQVDLRDDAWLREGIRYDTADRRLKANLLTLAIEATDKRTKLKFKQHNLVPELLYDKPVGSTVYPDIRKADDYKDHDTKFKREQDIHLDNVKSCASGSLFVKGRRTDIADSAFFARYFPGLDRVLPVTVPLAAVSHWDETVFEDMRVTWKQVDIDHWMLVNRRDHATGALLESELSFKIARDMDEDWDYRLLKNASALYLALQATRAFMDLPPIFSYADPVSSFDIERAPA